jgi:hypothetical protein
MSQVQSEQIGLHLRSSIDVRGVRILFAIARLAAQRRLMVATGASPWEWRSSKLLEPPQGAIEVNDGAHVQQLAHACCL